MAEDDAEGEAEGADDCVEKNWIMSWSSDTLCADGVASAVEFAGSAKEEAFIGVCSAVFDSSVESGEDAVLPKNERKSTFCDDEFCECCGEGLGDDCEFCAGEGRMSGDCAGVLCV